MLLDLVAKTVQNIGFGSYIDVVLLNICFLRKNWKRKAAETRDLNIYHKHWYSAHFEMLMESVAHSVPEIGFWPYMGMGVAKYDQKNSNPP